MSSNTLRDLGANLDRANTSENFYDLLRQIFSPFANNLLDNTHMELYAAAILSVKEEIAGI